MSDTSSPRPSPELLARLRGGKLAIHAAHRTLSLEKKVKMVIELQRFALPIIAKRRPLKNYERPWPTGDEGSE